MADGTYRRKQMVREIRIYIEGIGDESEDETKIENTPQKRPGFRSKIQPGKEMTAGLRSGFIHVFKELYVAEISH